MKSLSISFFGFDARNRYFSASASCPLLAGVYAVIFSFFSEPEKIKDRRVLVSTRPGYIRVERSVNSSGAEVWVACMAFQENNLGPAGSFDPDIWMEEYNWVEVEDSPRDAYARVGFDVLRVLDSPQEVMAEIPEPWMG